MWSSAIRPGRRARRFVLSGLPCACPMSSGLALSSGSLVFRVKAHRAVFGPGVLEQRDLVHADREQRAPVLAEPALRVALADKDRLLQVIGGNRSAVRLLVAPGPGHGPKVNAR